MSDASKSICVKQLPAHCIDCIYSGTRGSL